MVEVRRCRPNDAPDVASFAASLPDEDRNFLKQDLGDPAVAERWSAEQDADRFVALRDGQIAGLLALYRLPGWSRHVSELRTVVAPDSRDLGIGQRLVQTGLAAAVAAGTNKVIVEAISDHQRTIGMLQANGFTPEALLVDHVQDRSGQQRDLMVLSCKPEQMIRDLEVLGIDDALQDSPNA